MITTILHQTRKAIAFIALLLFSTVFSIAQSGPAGIGTSSNNVLWLRADQGTSTIVNGDPVSAWNDITSNANNAAQGIGANQPLFISSGINGFPTIRFDGADDYLVVPDADNLDNTNGVSVFVVAQPIAPDILPRGIVSKRVSAGNEEAYYLFTHTGSNLHFNARTNRINGNDAVTDQPQIFSAVYNGSLSSNQSKIFYNGILSGEGNGPVSIGNMVSDLHVGILNPGYAQGFNGDISEVIVYRDNLNQAERLIVETYLSNRYNITITPVSYSSTTHKQDFIGIGHAGGDKYSDTENLGSGILLSERNGTLDETNEFVFAGHDGTVHGIDNSDLPVIPSVNLEDRWQRIFYIERVQGGTVDAGTTDIRISFDFTGTGITLATDRVYYLLYRAGTLGTFSEVAGGTGMASEGKVSVNLSSANFASGYYTIAKSDQEIRTWYSISDGDWDEPNTWSTKQTEWENPSFEIPGILDRAVIIDNKTVTVTLDNTQCGILDVIDGTVDFGITTGNTFSTITGQSNGKIKLAADNFPSGDASGFANESSGGTVEYYGTGYDLSTSRTFRNMIVNLTNTTDQLVLLSNYTLNGSLTISSGEFFFGNTSTTARIVTVYEHVEVGANGKIRTGTGITRHQFNLYGDFTNYGNVQFTSRGAINYTVDNADGIVDVNFRSAARNQNMLLEGPTRFYRIAIEKGLTNTYELFMEATVAANFELFGFANEGHPENSQLAVNNNSLGLAYGTVRIGSNITIPRLNGGGNYNVSENAILWVDGGTVTKPSGTAVVVYGKVKVSAGTFNAQINSGITTRLNGVFESTGGTTNLGQFRTSIFGTQHIGGYLQSGGYVTVNQAWGSSADYYLFTLSYEGNVFNLTGGTLHIIGTNAKGSIFINSDIANQNVSASATMILESTNATPFRITSRASLPTVTMSRSGAGIRTFVLEGGSVGTGAGTAELTALPLITKGSLTINDNVIFNPKGENVTIGRTYIIGNGASYIAASNTTTFSGATSSYTLSVNASATTKYFHNLTINNSGYTGTLSTSGITVGNNLTVTAGTLATGPQTITVRGNISNSGTITSTTGGVLITDRGIVNQINVTNGGNYTAVPIITIAAPGTGTQATAVAIFNGTPSATNPLPIARIAITNTGAGYTSAPAVSFDSGAATATATISTTHELGGNGNGVFGNLVINEEHPSEATGKVEVTYLAAKQIVSGILTLMNGILDLKTFNLDLEGSLSSETVTDYSETKLIRTAGNHSDGGLTRTISANATYLFPLGTYKTAANVNRYGWAMPTFSSVPVGGGKVQINGVPQKLPTLSTPVNPTDNRYLVYYWRLRNSGFSVTPDIHNRFQSYVADYTWNGGHNNHIIGKVIGVIRYGDGNGAEDLGENEGQVDGKRTLNYSVIKPLEEGEFTAGFKPIFNGTIEVYYLRANGNWRNVNTWSFTRGGASAGDYPKAGDIAVIRRLSASYSGLVEVTNAEVCAKVIFDDENGWSSGSPRIWFSNAASFGSEFSIIEVADTHQGGLDGINDGERHGAVIKYDLFEGYAGEFPVGDFGDFNQYPNALVIYTKEGATSTVTLSSAMTEYPQVWFDPPNNRTFILPDTHVTFNGMVIMPYGQTLRMNSGSNGGATFKKRLNIGHPFGAGYFEFAGNASADQTVTVETNINLYNNGQLRINSAAGGGRTHLLKLNGDITMETGCSINLGDGNSANSNVNLELNGEGINSLTGAGTASVTLSKITMNKGTSQNPSFSFNWPFTLTGPTNGTTPEKAIQLQNGRLILNNSLININLSTGGGDFYIPSTSGLVVQAGEVNVSGADNGILLDGLLRVETGGTIDMDGGAGENNYIEYSASGNATIEVTGGALTVGSQIRRGTSNSSGVLRYTQTGGTVIVGKNAAPVGNRGTFEVLNSLSRFIYTSGSLTVVRPQTGATEASVLLEPAIGSAGNTTIQLGNADTPAASVITLKSTLELGNLTIGGASTTAQLKDRSLTIKRDLTIGTGCSFSGFDGINYRNLTVNRHIVNNGTANFNTDTLLLTGTSTFPAAAMQEITGNVTVNHLVVEPEASVTLQPASSLEVNGDLFLNSGQLIDGGNEILVKGNVTNSASHASSNPALGGIVFGGTSLQRVYGTGQFGRIEVDNANGVQLENSISLNNHLTLTNGILQLQSNKLTLGVNTEIFGGPFDDNKMIAVGGGDFQQGIQKTFPVVPTAVPTDPYNEFDPAFTYEYTFPIGVDNGTVKKFTPVEFYVASNDIQGSINLYPVNRKHITLDDTQTDVLQYYWIMNSSGLSNFTSLIHTHYKDADVVGDETAYIGAKLYDNFWSKFEEIDYDLGPPEVLAVEVVYEDDDYVAFITDGADFVTGEYTAGIEPHIPDQVPLFYSRQDGDWTDPNTWEREDGGAVPANGPAGQRVHIRTAHTVTISSNYRRAYRTTINGRLELGTTKNHILGYIAGIGTLSSETSSLPAGDYTNFFACGIGGTMEWAGGTYGLPSSITQYNNLTITGTGTKTMPNLDMTICGDLRVEGSATLKQPEPSSGYRYTNIEGSVYLVDDAIWDMSNMTWIRLKGDFTKDNTALFKATNYSTTFMQLNGNSPQNITGDFTDTDRFRYLLVNNPGIVSMNGPSEVVIFLYLINGARIQTTVPNLLTLLRAAGNGLTGTVNGLVEGPISINMMTPGTTNQFLPVGKNNIRKYVYPITLTSTVQYWTGEYFNTSPISHTPSMSHESMVGLLETISQSEYWRVSGPAGHASHIRLTFDGTSDVAAGVSNKDNLRIVYWNGSAWEILGTGAAVTDPLNGTITSTGSLGSFTFDGTEQYFTIGAVEEVVIPTAQITSADAELCEGGTYELTISLTGIGPWQIDYTDGTTSYTNVAVPSSPHTISIGGMAVGSYTYSLDAVRDNASTPGFIYGPTPTVDVYASPTAYNVTAGGDICGGTTTTIHLDGSEIGFTYQLYRNAAYFGTELPGTGGALTFTGVDQQGTYTVRAFNSAYTGCFTWMAGSGIVALGSSASGEIIQLLTATPTCEQEEVQLRIAFTGTPPFTFTLADGQGNSWVDLVALGADLDGTGPYTYDLIVPTNPVWIAPNLPTVYTYTITSMNDSGGCGSGTVVGAGISVNIFKIPETGPQYHIPNDFGN